MKITFISNYYNHHQEEIAKAFSAIPNIQFHFVATTPIPQFRLDLGYTDMNKSYPFIVCSYESKEARKFAEALTETSDIVIIGSAPDSYIKYRLKNQKLTFRYSERWFKHKPWYLSGPTAWINFYRYHLRYKNCPLYMLAASAFTAADVHAIGAYKNKVFKWGYFTKVDMDFKLEAPEPGASSSEITPLMWCARFLSLKHPELPIKLARRLKDKGYNFVLDMYGSGVELEKTQKLTRELDVCDVVNFCGVLPNDQILEQMKKHEIFLFTSDFNEGWGAVLNESMSCGCAVVASHAIGSVPFLIQDGVNGLIYENENLDSLTEKVEFLLTHPDERFVMRQRAVKTMQEQWNAVNAVNRFIQLSTKLLAGDNQHNLYSDGVCSTAADLKNDWFI